MAGKRVFLCGQDSLELEISPGCSLEGMMLKLKLQYFGHLTWSWLVGKDSDAGRDWRQEEKGTTEDEMAGWHHWLDGREFEWNPGVGDGQGGLACCNSWGHKESGMTEWLNWLNWTDGVHVHSAIFLNHKEVGSNSKASHRRESREIISSEVRDAGWDTRWYHIISPLRVKVRWIQLNLLPRDRGSQT